MLENFMREHDYPLDHVLHRFYTLDRNFEAALDEGEDIIRGWLDKVSAIERKPRPLSDLRIALQCGGSDAFSGVAGNPLAGWVAKEVIRHGGSANLAETDELIGAEPYILANTRDLATVKRFLEKIKIFKQRISWHGHNAKGNVTGGNYYRGLYNFAIKSIGAGRKKDPDVCLDYVIDYGEPMKAPGFYFMDSPGNDLESIAGQVASGCNMIFFITGNGSITNFPFVPTIKFITTTKRWKLLSRDMDVNAGRYLDGTTMEELGKETFDYSTSVASGLRSTGERAGHSQVSIWRDWHQTDASALQALQQRTKPDGKPVVVPAGAGKVSDARLLAIPGDRGYVMDQVGLIVPTSLCSVQIARMIVDDLNSSSFSTGRNISRFVTLMHTEGCGVSTGENIEHFTRVLVGHLIHPYVKKALLLEHGCEHTHNDLMRHVLMEYDVEPGRFGYASVQLDGGIEKVVDRVKQWFLEELPLEPPAGRREVGLEALSLGLLTSGHITSQAAAVLARVAVMVTAGNGTVVIPENAAILNSAEFLQGLGWKQAPEASLDYGQVIDQKGMHIMSTPTAHVVENLTGLCATGVQSVLAHVEGIPIQGHPMIPVIQVTTDSKAAGKFNKDLDYVIHPEEAGIEHTGRHLLHMICETVSLHTLPRLWNAGNTDFQITRGRLGVSL